MLILKHTYQSEVLRLTHIGGQHILNLHSDLLYYYKF